MSKTQTYSTDSLASASYSKESPLLLMREKIQDFFLQSEDDIRLEEERIVRLEIKIAQYLPLEWLHQQQGFPKVYWQDRDQAFTMAGVGQADLIQAKNRGDHKFFLSPIQAKVAQNHPSLRYYGGFRFSLKSTIDRAWLPFGNGKFFLPRFEIYQEEETKLALNFIYHPKVDKEVLQEKLLEELEELDFNSEKTIEDLPSLEEKKEVPSYEKWEKNLQIALQAFQEKEMDKVVLARQSVSYHHGFLSATNLLKHLQNHAEKAFIFLFQLDSDHAFLGATPERLYSRQGNSIYTEAVAGTRPRGESPEEDHWYEEDLRGSEKDRHEHQLVERSISESLHSLCQHYQGPMSRKILKLRRVQHLYSSFQGELKDDIQSGEILTEMHPTPAVAGYPKENSLKRIAKWENFDRGWYAGPIGWLGQGKEEFAVGIRSALIHKDKISFFAGAGIVPGSSSQSEWQEVSNKINNVKKLFHS